MAIPRTARQRLKDAAWLHDPDTQRIFDLLDGRVGRTRAVGGVVRDTLADHERQVQDLDLATELLPSEVVVRAEASGIAVYPTGTEHGTVTLKSGSLTAEVTTL